MPRVVHHSILVPLDRGGFSEWNLMLTESRQPQLTTQFIRNTAVFCEGNFGKNNALYARLTYKRTRHSW